MSGFVPERERHRALRGKSVVCVQVDPSARISGTSDYGVRVSEESIAGQARLRERHLVNPPVQDAVGEPTPHVRTGCGIGCFRNPIDLFGRERDEITVVLITR